MLNYEITEKGVPESIRRAIHETVDTVNIDAPRLTAQQRLNGVADRLCGMVVHTQRKTELLVVQGPQHVGVYYRAAVEPFAVITDDGLTLDELLGLKPEEQRIAA
jgi:hypothetical protein